jgi:hypothetical protein
VGKRPRRRLTHARAGDLKKARAEVNAFHERLCQITVLDPACGSGNFLYVSLQHLKILEGEVLDGRRSSATASGWNSPPTPLTRTNFSASKSIPAPPPSPNWFCGLATCNGISACTANARPPEPILRAFKNIQCRDAVLAYDGEPQPALDLPGLPEPLESKITFGIGAARKRTR